MIFEDRLRVYATSLSAQTLAVGTTINMGAVTSADCRTLLQCINDGGSDPLRVKANSVGMTFTVTDGTNWQTSLCDVLSTTQIIIRQLLKGSNGANPVTIVGSTPVVYNTVPADWLTKVITTDDGVGISGLTAGVAVSTGLLIQYNPATGKTESVKISDVLALGGGTAVQQITVGTIASQVAGTPFSVTGTYTNGTPSALQWSVGGTWNNATATISGGTYTITGVTVPAASNSQTVVVRDATTLVSGTSPAFLVTAAPYITTNTPNSQVVNVPFQVTGWYYNFTPTALDYRFSDDAAGVWTQATSGVSITGGAFQFNATCTTTNASRTVTVRDRTTQTILATSGAFSVAAGAATVTSVSISPSPATVIGGKTQQFTGTATGTNNPSQVFTWSMVSGPGSIDATTGLYTAAAATTSAQTAVIKGVSQQDNNYSAQVTITIPAQTITVTTPGSQTVGTPYLLAGTWTGLQPTALQFQYADNGGTATTWASFTSTPTINANGTWNVSVTPTAASTSRIMSVRDATTLIQGSSSAYVVNAATVALKDTYLLTSTNSATSSFTAATLSNSTGTGTASTTVRVNIRSALTTSATYPANADAKFVWGKADANNIANSVCPAVFSDNYVKAGSVNGNTADGNTTTIGTLTHLASWSDGTSTYFGTFTTQSGLNAIGTPGTYVLWVMYKDGTSKMYDNNQGQSNPLTWVLS